MKIHIKLIDIAVFLILALLSGLAFFLANNTSQAFENFRSPLTDNPPAPGRPLGDPAVRRVILVVIDGLRVDTALDDSTMPTLAFLRSQGAFAVSQSKAPSYSLPGYATLLTGAWPDFNSAPAFNTDFERIPALTQDTLFKAVRDRGIQTAIAAYHWFGALLPKDQVIYAYYDPQDDRAADERVMAAALPWLEQPEIGFLLIHLDQVDYAGHNEGGPRDQRWLEAAARVDQYVDMSLSRIDLNQDLLIITSDHGHILAGGHGGKDPDTLSEPLILIGKGVNPGEYSGVKMVDIPVTIAALLGARLPASSQGRVLTEIVNLDEQVLSNLPAIQNLQQKTLLSAYARAVGETLDSRSIDGLQSVDDYQQAIEKIQQSKLNRERLGRAIPILLLLAGLVWLVIRLGQRRAVRLLAVTAAYWAIFLFRHAVADQIPFSFSSISSSDSFVFYVITTTGAAFGFVWVLSFILERIYQSSSWQAFCYGIELSASITSSLLLVCLAYFLCFGMLPTWILPDMRFAYINLLALTQIVFILPAGIFFGGIGAVITRYTPKPVE